MPRQPRLVNVPGGIRYSVSLGRAGTYRDRPQLQPKAFDGGLAPGPGILGIGGFLSNLVVQRGRWVVEARPVSGPGLDDLPVHRRVVRNREEASALADDWVRCLEAGEPVTEHPPP